MVRAAASVLTDEALCLAVAAGNPGALRVVGELVAGGRRDVVERLYDLNVTGPRVWLSYKDLGDQTIETMVANVERGDLVARLAALGY